MDQLPKLPSEITTGFVVIALAYIVWQVVKLVYPLNRKKSDDEKNQLLSVISRNATAMENLSQNVAQNTAATNASIKASEANKTRDDVFIETLLHLMRASGQEERRPTAPTQPKPTP